MRITLVILIIIHSAFCFAQENEYPAYLIDKGLTENANAVVRLSQMDIQISSAKEMKYTIRKVVTVFNKLGNKHARTHAFYDKETKIKNIEASIYDLFGNEIEHIKKKDFQDVSAADGFSLYLDDRLLKYRYTPIQYPYTIDFRCEIESSDTGAFPSWYFLTNYLVSVEKSKYSISYASEDLKPIIKEYNLKNIDFIKSEDKNNITYEASNLIALESESLGPEFSSIAPRLAARLRNFYFKGNFAQVDNWKDLGLWVNNQLLTGRNELPEETKIKAKQLVSGISDDLEKARIIYKYVQENTRYVSIQIGIGGLRPISAIDVDQVKYGDCKGLSNYTKALLESVGVTAFYTVIEAGNDKIDFDNGFADISQGNHVILALPYQDKYYWMDCTSQTLPFGFVGDFTDDRKALVIKPNGGELIKTVAYLNEQNHQQTNAQYEITPDGSIGVEATIATQGTQYDGHFNLETQDDDEIKKYYNLYWKDINNLKINSYEFENNRDDVIFTENIKFTASNFAKISGNRLFFEANPLDKNTFVPKRYRNRKQPLDIQRGFWDKSEFLITIPDGYSVESLPNFIQEENEFGHYRTKLKYEKATNSIRFERSFLVKAGSYPKEKYNAYRAFRKKVVNGDNGQIVLIKKS